MEWFKHYQPPEPSSWQGRKDGPGAERFHEIIQLADIRNQIPSASKVPTFGLLGFASEEGIIRNQGRLGASLGPKALRGSFSNFPAPDPSTLALYDLGDIICGPNQLEEAQDSLAIIIAMLLAQNVRPIILGGGHEVAWGNFKGISTFNPTVDCAIINFDAHYDLRPLIDGKGTSGTSFTQIADWLESKNLPFNYYCFGIQRNGNTRALKKKAQDLNVKTLYADEIHTSTDYLKTLAGIIHKHTTIYLTLCLDVLAAPFAPGVSAPQPLGLFLPTSFPPWKFCQNPIKLSLSTSQSFLPPLTNTIARPN